MSNFPASMVGTKHVEVIFELDEQGMCAGTIGGHYSSWQSQGFFINAQGASGHAQIDVKVNGSSIGTINAKISEFKEVVAEVDAVDQITDNGDGTYTVGVMTGKTISYDVQLSGNWDMVIHTFGAIRGAGNYKINNIDYGTIDQIPTCPE